MKRKVFSLATEDEARQRLDQFARNRDERKTSKEMRGEMSISGRLPKALEGRNYLTMALGLRSIIWSVF